MKTVLPFSKANIATRPAIARSKEASIQLPLTGTFPQHHVRQIDEIVQQHVVLDFEKV